MTNENITPEEIKEQLIKNDDKHSPNYSLFPENQLQEAPIFDLNDSASFSEQQFNFPTTPVTELDPTQN